MKGRREQRTLRAPGVVALLGALFFVFLIQLTNEDVILHGANIPLSYLTATGQYWRPFTAMFLHGDGTIPGTLLHLGLNVYALLQFGTFYEVMFGTRRFLVIYFLSGILASVASALFIQGLSVGASGAIFGVVGALVVSIRRSRRYSTHPHGKSLSAQCIMWILANIALGLQIPRIDNAGHIGGLVAGLVLATILPYHEPPPPPSREVIDV